jgi:hypothetical protein
VQQMSLIFLSDVDRFRSDASFRELLVEGASCTESGRGSAEVYGRFMGGSDQNTDNSGRFEQSGHFMHMAQSRINTGDCASC